MPSFARDLETTLHNALGEASKRRYEYATLMSLAVEIPRPSLLIDTTKGTTLMGKERSRHAQFCPRTRTIPS